MIKCIYESNRSCLNQSFAYWQVKLCGHGTLVASRFVFEQDLANSDTIRFATMSGILTSKRIRENSSNFLIELDFPSIPMTECEEEYTPSILKSLNVTSVNQIYKTTTFEAFLIVLYIFHQFRD